MWMLTCIFTVWRIWNNRLQSLHISPYGYKLMHTFFLNHAFLMYVFRYRTISSVRSHYSWWIIFYDDSPIAWHLVDSMSLGCTSNCLMALKLMKLCHTLHRLQDFVLKKSKASCEPENGQYTNDICVEFIFS